MTRKHIITPDFQLPLAAVARKASRSASLFDRARSRRSRPLIHVLAAIVPRGFRMPPSRYAGRCGRSRRFGRGAFHFSQPFLAARDMPHDASAAWLLTLPIRCPRDIPAAKEGRRASRFTPLAAQARRRRGRRHAQDGFIAISAAAPRMRGRPTCEARFSRS